MSCVQSLPGMRLYLKKEKEILKNLIPAFILVTLVYSKICETFKKIVYINA